VSLLRHRWLQMLVSGLVLLLLVERTLIATSSPNYVPSVILLGAFLVPITFTTYLYERLPNWNVSLPALAVCFLWDTLASVRSTTFVEFLGVMFLSLLVALVSLVLLLRRVREARRASA
jgi:hypothetical protein